VAGAPGRYARCVATLLKPLLALVVGLVLALPAEAQIYTWRDASGTLVLSNVPPPGTPAEARTYEVSKAPAVKATRPAEAPPGRFDDLIERHATIQGLSPELVRAVIQVESAFNPVAVSSKGAMGLMQLMPATARDLGVHDPFHPEQNIRGGSRYLRWLLDRYDGNVELALAGYNAGPGAVDRYGQQVPPFRETREYVQKVTGVTGPPPAPAAPVIYKWLEIVDGRPVPRYSNEPPSTGAYEIVGRR
jgi:soluble lytic murein transglycosylase-like protein